MDPIVDASDGTVIDGTAAGDGGSALSLPSAGYPQPPALAAFPVPPAPVPPQPAGPPVPWGQVIRLGFTCVLLAFAVALIALGYTAAAAVGLILGVGVAAAEIIRRLG